MTIKPKNYFEGRKCARCGSTKTTQGFGSPRWYRHYDKKGNWDGKSYLCHICYRRMDRLSRNKSLSKDSSTGKGYIGEQIFCKTRGLKNSNIEKDNFKSEEDTIDPEYGKVQIKLGTPLRSGNYKVKFGRDHVFNNLVILCMDIFMKNVERVYIIPEEELYGISTVEIYINNNSKYEKFRNDEKPYKDTYHKMKLKDCPILLSENKLGG